MWDNRFGNEIWEFEEIRSYTENQIHLILKSKEIPITFVDKNICHCSSIGVCFTTDIHIKYQSNGIFIAKAGIAIMGSVNFKESINSNPFDENFHDNYVQGKAYKNIVTAIKVMYRNKEKIKQGLWT